MRAQLKEKTRALGVPRINGQATLELTISLIVCMVLLMGAAKIFVWLNKTLVERQEAYQQDRKNPVDKIDFYTPEKLDIFGEGK